MKLPVTIHHARLGTDAFRVIRPGRPLTHALLTDRDWHLAAYLGQDAALMIAGAVAARRPLTTLTDPLTDPSQPPVGLQLTWHHQPRLDLVLLHHSLQFAPARWKQVRQRLGPGRPQAATLPEAEHADEMAIGHAARHYRDNRDKFPQHLHAETLFMTGSAKVFRETADRFLDIARHGPAWAQPRTSRTTAQSCTWPTASWPTLANSTSTTATSGPPDHPTLSRNDQPGVPPGPYPLSPPAS